jgi:hypothetical protein
MISKPDLLSALESAEGIIFILAHASRAHIILPGGASLEINPADIAGLSLHHNPFVFLRICHGADTGFADAFIKAGAKAVWANRGAVEAPSKAVRPSTTHPYSRPRGSIHLWLLRWHRCQGSHVHSYDRLF